MRISRIHQCILWFVLSKKLQYEHNKFEVILCNDCDVVILVVGRHNGFRAINFGLIGRFPRSVIVLELFCRKIDRGGNLCSPAIFLLHHALS